MKIKQVDFYAIGEVKLKVGFPNAIVCCDNCRWCQKEYGFNRWRCTFTDELIYNTETIGRECPIEFKADEEV